MTMTDCALAEPGVATPTIRAASTAVSTPATPRRGRAGDRPTGIPRWTRWLGVTVAPLTPAAPGEPTRWVMSAGVGAGHVAAVFADSRDTNALPTEGIRP